ncbi:GNAT family N-acetyltransferase [Microbacterium sp. zg-Y818]|uniref:GNAT family N-acetyltransferase n=1 Tax=unclassified Microbacterium TaxID=2609290 RepID=UPI00214C3C0F|nr:MULTISPECIES: GNAT family N-acetyltransferase [unclassified Microbacterium]MCR2801934.1 GNAT family N-acetyltransferase [Microbacterium sp. zg.Y818]WIM22808.1 GNAT family N-acetyltransferase [Microbacterium sp. zg-Y818]
MTEQTLADRIGHAPAPAMPQHPDVPTWRMATPDDIDAIHGIASAAGRVDHPTWTVPRDEIADTFEMSHIDHSRDTVIGFAADGAPVAYGSAIVHPSRELRVQVDISGEVHPAWRRRGIGAQVVQWQYSQALRRLVESGSTLPGTVRAYAEGANDDAATLFERHGLQVQRWFTTMERDLSQPVPALEVPDGIVLVPYSSERALQALEARNDAFRDHWGSLPSTNETWQKFVGGPLLRPDLSTLALDGDRIVAFCLGSVNEEDWAALGASHVYIDLIGVVRSHRGRGLAPLVIAEALRAAAAAGLEKAVLDVDTESPTGAHSLYERLGFAATERERVLVREF